MRTRVLSRPITDQLRRTSMTDIVLIFGKDT
jgi:hypothetical protein